MSRLMPTSMFNRIFPDRIDPDNPKRYLCRFCGKPSVKPKHYYCSDDCYWNCQRAVAWWFARDGTFKRDNGLCVDCGVKLDYNKKWDCHHIIPVVDLHDLAYQVVRRNPDWDQVSEIDKRRGFAVMYTLLVHDINNLVTLCPACHKKRHAAKPKHAAIPVNIITLEQFFDENLDA